MGRSRVWVSEALLENFIEISSQCNFQVGAKEGYDKRLQAYLMGVEGPNVPDAKEVEMIFTRWSTDPNDISVTFTERL